MDSTQQCNPEKEVQAHQQGLPDWLIQEEMISEAITELQGSIKQGSHL